MAKKLEDYVITIPDFPEPGIMFRDVTSILESPEGLKLAIDGLHERIRDLDFDIIAGTESRGFMFGVPLSYMTGKGFLPIRKKGKLPRETISEKYDLEYGSAELEIHKNSVKEGMKVLLIDDLVATGGSALASAHLIERLGGKVIRMEFIMELAGLEPRKKLAGYDVDSLIIYPGK